NQTFHYLLGRRKRWEHGGAGDDVVVVANFSNVPLPSLNIGLPRGGQWHVRFNSGAKVYDLSFENGDSFETAANPGDQDGLKFNANMGAAMIASLASRWRRKRITKSFRIG